MRRGDLLPLDRVDEVAVAVGADVQVAHGGRARGIGSGSVAAASARFSKYTTSIARPDGSTTRRTYWLLLVGLAHRALRESAAARVIGRPSEILDSYIGRIR